jgi:MFS family permease
MLFTLAFGAVLVPKLNLILALICRQYIADKSLQSSTFTALPIVFGDENPQCQIPEVQALVSRFTLYGNLITGILSAVVSPRLGSLSDRYGRKRIIAASTLGTLASEVITIITATWPDLISVNWLLLGFFFDGIFGSFTAVFAITHSYATDCSTPANRNIVFGYFHGCLFTGIALGPIFGGYITKATGKILTIFYLALGGHLLSMALLLFVIPESLSRERQLAAREKYRIEKESNRNVLGQTWVGTLKRANILAPLDILFPTGAGSSRALRFNLVLLSAIDTIMFGVAMGSMTVVVIYSELMFGWGNLETSLFVSIVNTCRVLILVLVLPLLTLLIRGRPNARGSATIRKSGMDVLDINIIRIAVLFDMLGYLGYALVRTGPLFTLSGAIASIGGMGSPTLQSALTKHVPHDRTGQLLGAIGLLHALARIVAPTVFNLIYSLTVGKFTQTVFVCLASAFGLALVCSWFIKPHGKSPFCCHFRQLYPF